jgi:AraC family ethanolamine operon transcriptional activator
VGATTHSKGIFPAGHIVDLRLSSFEEIEAYATQWKLNTSQLERGAYRCALQSFHTSHVQLARTWRELSSHIEAEIPRGSVLVGFPTPGTRVSFRGRNLREQEAIFQRDTSLLDFSLSHASDVVSLCVDAEEMDRRAWHLWHRPFPGTTGTLAFESPEVARHAAAFSLEMICDNLSAERLSVPGFAKALENRVLDGILCSLKDHTPAVGTLGRHAMARRAVALLRDRCAEDLSITDLCQATGATRRTLHLGFLELYGVPPMQYLKALRLCRVRRELGTTADAETRITDVAMRWGFTHLGRFASSYNAFFGELPSVQRARTNRNHRNLTIFS